jgi:hypothetical protein
MRSITAKALFEPEFFTMVVLHEGGGINSDCFASTTVFSVYSKQKDEDSIADKAIPISRNAGEMDL